MKKILIILITMVTLAGCRSQPEPALLQEKPGEVAIGLGYGFLDKQIDVYINGDLVISLIGTQEIEDHAQRLGTKIVKVVNIEGNIANVQVIIEGVKSDMQTLNLETGRIIEIYNHPIDGLSISNTEFLILE